jgi:hypothetical protein
MHIVEAVKIKNIDTNEASPTSLASDGLELGLESSEKFQTVLASPAETPDPLGYGVVGTMGSSKARLSVSTSSGAGAGEAVPKVPATAAGLLRWSRARRRNMVGKV